MTKIDELLSLVRVLNVKLYGEEGFEGDIPSLKTFAKEQTQSLSDLSNRLITLEVKVKERTKSNKKALGASSTIGGIIGAAVMAGIDYLIRKN